MKLDGKVALITGVTSGIDRAAVRLFIDAGAIVFGVDRNQAAGQVLATELQAGHLFKFFPADLSIEAACIATVQNCYQVYGRIDILYNNAGISILEPFVQATAESLETTMATNFKSVFYLCQQVIPKMQQQGSGVIHY